MKKIKTILVVISLSLTLVLLVAIITSLFLGKLNVSKIKMMAEILQQEELSIPVEKPRGNDQEGLYIQYMRKMEEREGEVAAIQKKLDDLRVFYDIKMKEIESLLSELNSVNAKLTAKKEELETFKRNWESVQKEKNFLSNLTRFSKMEPESVAAIMKSLVDDDVKLYLNNMKADMQAEVVEVLRKDPEFGIARLNEILFKIKKLD